MQKQAFELHSLQIMAKATLFFSFIYTRRNNDSDIHCWKTKQTKKTQNEAKGMLKLQVNRTSVKRSAKEATFIDNQFHILLCKWNKQQVDNLANWWPQITSKFQCFLTDVLVTFEYWQAFTPVVAWDRVYTSPQVADAV